MERTGLALVISAPSGAGKSTLIKALRQRVPDLSFSVSVTTRSPRLGEVDGYDYHFIDRESFLAKRDSGYFAEWAQIHDHFYGTPLEPTVECLKSGRDLLFDIDVQGAARLKKTLPQACFVFVLPPSLEELERRLIRRGTDSKEVIAQRLARARAEIKEARWYDAIILNDDLNEGIDDLYCIYTAATLAPTLHEEWFKRVLSSPIAGGPDA